MEELIGTYLNKSTADVILLGGDFNAGPDAKEGETEEIFRYKRDTTLVNGVLRRNKVAHIKKVQIFHLV